MNLPDSPTHPIAFGHYSAKNDISGVTTWLERLLLRLHSDHIPVIAYLQHFGSDVEESNLLHTLRQAGIPVEIEPRFLYIEDDICGILRFLNRHQPQIFLPQCLIANYYGAKLAAQSGLPWALTIHSDDPVYWAIAEATSPEVNSGSVIGVSDFICQKAIAQGFTQTPQSIPYGVSIPSDQASFSEAPFRVAFSGRVIEEQKRISLILSSMALACRQDSRIQCYIIGKGREFAYAQDWVNNQGLGDRIQFLGRLSPGDVQIYLAQCQALLLMSDYEGLPVAMLEAMAIGVVPVARAIPSGIPELVYDKKTGLLIDDTPESAAMAILELANDPDLWSKCSWAAKQLVTEQYSEEACYQRWLQVIDELCARSAVTYPIPIPEIVLPTLYPELLEGYRHKPSLFNHALSHYKRCIRNQIYRIKRSIIS